MYLFFCLLHLIFEKADGITKGFLLWRTYFDPELLRLNESFDDSGGLSRN